LDFSRRARATGAFSTNGAAPVAEAAFKSDVVWQDVKFAHPAKGRYLCLEALDSVDGEPSAAVAELDVVNPRGEPLSKALWKVLWVSSEETVAESGNAENALDGQPATYWHTEYSGAKPGYPHRMVLDLGETTEIGGVRYLPRDGKSADPGHIKNCRFYVSDQPFGLQPTP
jgi:beta-galactosidase